jgi:signal transduction histidine kinase/CheY-like chemotaxis protein
MVYPTLPLLSRHCLRCSAWIGQIIIPLLIGLGALGPIMVRAQSHRIDGAAAGLIEAGAPQFDVRTYQTLGLDAPPTDLHVLPDGRILLFAGQQIAIGDGVRWERFQQAADDPLTAADAVGVDRDGTIYMGVAGGFARVEFAADARWHLRLVAPWTSEDPAHAPILRSAIQVGDDWFWHGDSGPLVGWRPGKAAQVFGRANTTEQVVRLREDFYLSDRTTGQLWRLAKPAMEPVEYAPHYSTRDTITCGVPFGADQLLVGTIGRGLKLFDGKQTRAFPNTGHLGEGTHINALCEISGGLYAAAVESYGLVFFDRQGRTVQVLDHRLAHQLNHVRLLGVTGGAIVGLLGDGIVRVEVPSRVSHFEPITATRLTTSDPYRVDGRLWLNADGSMLRATYDPFGLLDGFAVDTPPGSFMYTFSNAMGLPIATTENGFFTRTKDQWTLVSPDIKNMRILEDVSHQGRWLYAAPHELGWLRPTTDHGVEIERFEAPAIDHPYHSETAEDGSVWIEQGNARVVRVRVSNGRPTAEAFGRESGLPDGWTQLFTLDGRIGFSTGGQILRFVESTRRFEPDEQFARDFPGLTNIVGRPVRDSLGRVWITANGSVQVLAGERGHWRNLEEPMPPGLQPFFFYCETNGVVWMHSDRRLARFDPSLPPAPSVPFRALITHLSFSSSGRTVFSLKDGLPPITSDDNSFAVHFVAPNCPFGSSTDFEVRLDGVDSRWSSAGSGGAAVFNHLKQGRYVLHVRPRAGGRTGDEATLAFTVLPPWYLTKWAYFGYVLGMLGLTVFIVRVVSILERREKARLEHLVEERTQELNEGIERRRRLEAQLLQAQKLESLGTLAGGIAHDFNNLLTSILGFCDLAGLTAGKDDPVQDDLRQIRTAGLRARDLVAQILTFSRQRKVTLVPLDLADHVTEALKLIRASTPSTIEIVSRLESGKILADPTQIHQIIVNLCNNAVHAMHGRLGRLEVALKCREISADFAAEVPNLMHGTAMHLTVSDTGSGMDAATLERIFDPFFTTKPPGEGTGLGLSIVQGIVHSHHGAMRVRSTPGSGTTFELFFSVTDATVGATRPVDTMPRGNNEEILVIDDEQAVAGFVSKKLVLLGYHPTVFSDPRAALAAVTAAPRRFHAMVSDLTMPWLTGIELVERCRAAGADFPVVIITGYRTDTVQTSLHNLRRCTVLPKPFAGDDLARALHRALHENTAA